MTEQEEAAVGAYLVDFLGLGLHKGQVQTAWGKKTPLGLYRTLKRIINNEAGDFAAGPRLVQDE